MTRLPPPVDVVIVGGGIVGITTAYYLLSNPNFPHPTQVTLIEPVDVAHAASGRAMGMIGRDWQESSTRQLAQLSWQCYEELAAKFGGCEAWDWMESEALGVEVVWGAQLSRYRSLPKGDSEGAAVDRTFNGSVYSMGSIGVGHV
ncbi:hypothetical protein JCM24511_04763 [Saitozyma sp. JCM 24511]|nr:hypothetical protein JCM24511_04763 [Saitozyma sp. JCM 24511]